MLNEPSSLTHSRRPKNASNQVHHHRSVFVYNQPSTQTFKATLSVRALRRCVGRKTVIVNYYQLFLSFIIVCYYYQLLSLQCSALRRPLPIAARRSPKSTAATQKSLRFVTTDGASSSQGLGASFSRYW